MAKKKKAAKKKVMKLVEAESIHDDSGKGETTMAVPIVEMKPVDTTSEFMVRLKSFMWRAGGMALVAGFTYVLKLGSVWAIDGKVLVDVMFMVLAGLVISEITKWLNNENVF